jgi:redox-sensitive bicupin YhaK (pirin superfamily)
MVVGQITQTSHKTTVNQFSRDGKTKPTFIVGFFTSVKYVMKIRPNTTRGKIKPPRTGLLTSYRSFSFEGYQDPRFINWGPIKTINDDRTEPGFVTTWHEHKNLDILSYVVRGQVYHKDNLGNELIAVPGQVQHMWCGNGIWHSEANKGTKTNRYLQIWIMPDELVDSKAKYTLVDRNKSFSQLPIEFKNSNIEIWAGEFKGSFVTQNSYMLVLEGSCLVNDELLEEGDAVETVERIVVTASDTVHLLLFELLTTTNV